VTDCRSCVVLPDVLQRFGKRLLSHGTVDVGGIAGEYELVVVALGGEHFGHTLVGENPIVHVIAHYVRIQQIVVAHFHPDS